MANFQFTGDIKTDVLFRGGEPTDGTSDYDTQVQIWINRAYEMVWTGGAEFDPTINENWWWLRASEPGILTLRPSITTGSVSVTNDSTTATLSASQTTDVAGYYFAVEGHADVFKVATHGGATATLTLDSVYTGTTNAETAYTLFRLDYALASDVLSIRSPMMVYQEGEYKVEGVELGEMLNQWPLSAVSSGVPQQFAMLTETEVQFSHFGGTSSTDLIRVEYDYNARPSPFTLFNTDTEEPVIPQQYRRLLADIALSFLFGAKSDNREDKTIGLARSGLQAMSREQKRKENTVGDQYGKIIPRQGQVQRYGRPLRTASGLIIG
jgi:hypothetical protein